MQELFEKTSIPKAFFKLAFPIVLGMVFSMVYNLADTFFVSQTQNTALVAGVSLCTPLFSFLIAIGDIFGLGGSSFISRLMGQKAFDNAARISSFCFYAAIAFGLVITVLLLVFERPILYMFGANAETYQYAADFYRIMSAGAALVIVSLVPNNIIRTEGLAVQSMVGSVIGTIVTIILDPIFILGLNMGAAGAALATIIGYGCTDLVFIWLTAKYCKIISLSFSKRRIPFSFIRQVLLIGIPAAITNIMTAFGTMVLNRYLAEYGATQVAALGIVMKIYTIVTLIMVGFAFGAQPLIGYTYGAKDMKRFKETVRFDLTVNVGYSLVLAAILMIFAPQIVALFLNKAAVITAGTYMLRAFLITTPFVGGVLVFTTMFQSIGSPLGAFIMSISRQGVVFYIVILIAAHVFGYHGAVWAQPIADVITCIMGLWLYRTLAAPKKQKQTE
jgi:putative MATE family efflux protein